jgi:hypothetical protein
MKCHQWPNLPDPYQVASRPRCAST